MTREEVPTDRIESGADGNAYKLWMSNGKEYKQTRIGHWVAIDEEPHEDFECDNCGFIHTFIDGHTAQYIYCPNCGFRMLQESEE